MSNTVTKYSQYPRSNFPAEVDNWDNMQDINSITAPLAIEYDNLINNKKYTDAALYRSVHPELDKVLFNAQKFNQCMDGIKATQQFFKDNVETYIKELENVTIGINDTLEYHDSGASENSYSVNRIHSLFLPEIITSPFDANKLMGGSSKHDIYCWEGSVAAKSSNLPHNVGAGMMKVVQSGTVLQQIIFSEKQIFYRFVYDPQDFSSAKWMKLYNNGLIQVTLSKNAWSGTTAPYTQTVSVVGISAEDDPVLVSQLSDSATVEEQKAYMKAFGIISSGTGTTADDSVTFKVYKKPAIDITIGLKGV